MPQQTPIAKFRAGLVSAALWENEIQTGGRTVRVLKATVQRRYRDADGQWKSSTSFNRNEIPLAMHCLQKAFERIIELQNGSSSNGGGPEVPA